MIGAVAICLIVGISDGDTLKARCDKQMVTIRVAEIDAPEKKQPFGTRSRQALADLCFQVNAEVRAVKLDRYGRTVARVSCRGKDASEALLIAGMAWVYAKYATDRRLPPLEAEAKAARVGLWADPSPTPPWEWRRLGRGPAGA